MCKKDLVNKYAYLIEEVVKKFELNEEQEFKLVEHYCILIDRLLTLSMELRDFDICARLSYKAQDLKSRNMPSEELDCISLEEAHGQWGNNESLSYEYEMDPTLAAVLRKDIWEVAEKALTKKENTVVKLRHLMNMSYRQVGDALGYSRGWIERIEAKALRKLRHPKYSCILKPASQCFGVYVEYKEKYVMNQFMKQSGKNIEGQARSRISERVEAQRY